jgi:hypothetical protein
MRGKGRKGGKLAKGVSIAVGSIFAVCGIILLAVGGGTGHRQYTILKTWPAVQAEVAKSQVTHYVVQNTDRHGRPTRSSTTYYEARIEFQYAVGGKPFVSPSASSASTSNYLAVKRVADEYAPGTRHLIRYNPANPNDIRFDAGYNIGFFLVPLVAGVTGVVFSGLGVGFLISSRTDRSLRCPSCGQRIERGQNFCPNCATPVQQTSGPQ